MTESGLRTPPARLHPTAEAEAELAEAELAEPVEAESVVAEPAKAEVDPAQAEADAAEAERWMKELMAAAAAIPLGVAYDLGRVPEPEPMPMLPITSAATVAACKALPLQKGDVFIASYPTRSGARTVRGDFPCA